MKEKITQTLNRGKIIANLREIADLLEKDAMKVGEAAIVLPESAIFEVEWKDKPDKKKLEIEMKW